MYQLYAFQNDVYIPFPLTISIKNTTSNIQAVDHQLTDYRVTKMLNIDLNKYRNICKKHNALKVDNNMQFRYIKDIENVIKELEPYIIVSNLIGTNIKYVGELFC